MYFEAIKWALKLTDAVVTPRPFPGGNPAGSQVVRTGAGVAPISLGSHGPPLVHRREPS
jgi:hypothetical protein